MPSQPKVVVLIPALNEAASIGLVLADIPQDIVSQVVVIDNGSTDGTPQIAAGQGATVIAEPQRGYGAACLKGIAYATALEPDLVVFLDADYSDHPDEMKTLIQPITEEGYDLVIGSRTRGRSEPGALLPQARFGNWLATALIRLFFGIVFTDLGPFRAIRFDRLLALNMQDTNFGWTVEMQVKAALMGYRTSEVPVSYRRRIGVSKITGTLSGTFKAGTKILYVIFYHLIRQRLWDRLFAKKALTK